MQQQMEVLQAEEKDDPVLRDIQKILYSTEVSPPFFYTPSFPELRPPAGWLRGARGGRRRRRNVLKYH